MKMAANDDEGLLTFLKANTPLNNTAGERWQCPAPPELPTDSLSLLKKLGLREAVPADLQPFS